MDTEKAKKMREEIAAVTRKRKCKSKTSLEWWGAAGLAVFCSVLDQPTHALIFIAASLVISRLDWMDCNANGQ